MTYDSRIAAISLEDLKNEFLYQIQEFQNEPDPLASRPYIILPGINPNTEEKVTIRWRTKDVQDIIIKAERLRNLAGGLVYRIEEMEGQPAYNQEMWDNLVEDLCKYYYERIELNYMTSQYSMEHNYSIHIKRNQNELLCSFYCTNSRISGRIKKYAKEHDYY